MSKSATAATPAQEPAEQPATDKTQTPAPTATDEPIPSPSTLVDQFRAKAHAWLNRAQSDVDYALADGAAIEGSTFGAMIERTAFYAFAGEHRFDTKPKRIPRRADGKMKIAAARDESGREIDFEKQARAGRGWKLLDLVGKVSPQARATLVAYHGILGAKFAQDPTDNGSGGVGNRDVAVYPLTATGAKWIPALREQSRKGGAAHLANYMRDEELLANQYMAAKRKRDDIRMRKLSMCGIEARAMIAEAHEVLEGARMYLEDSAHRIRRTNVATYRGRDTLPTPTQMGTRVLMRSATGTVMHGPFTAIDASEWNDVGRRECLVQVVL
jgi:hypothetical protein